MAASSIVPPASPENSKREGGKRVYARISPGETKGDISPGADRFATARQAAAVKVGRRPPAQRVALTAARPGARSSEPGREERPKKDRAWARAGGQISALIRGPEIGSTGQPQEREHSGAEGARGTARPRRGAQQNAATIVTRRA